MTKAQANAQSEISYLNSDKRFGMNRGPSAAKRAARKASNKADRCAAKKIIAEFI